MCLAASFLLGHQCLMRAEPDCPGRALLYARAVSTISLVSVWRWALEECSDEVLVSRAGLLAPVHLPWHSFQAMWLYVSF